MNGPKVLTLDVETSPNLAHVWGLFKQNVSLSQLMATGQVIAFAAKWLGSPKVEFRSDFHDGHEAMIHRAHELLDEADIVIHYNGKAFDIPWLQREFVEAGLTPPAPFRQIDLLAVVRKQFRFASNKLDHVARQLGLGGKVKHTGHELWVDCLKGDPKAWGLMKRYNIGDVRLTEALYLRLLPWVPSHPHIGLYTGEGFSCPNCGSTHLQRRGYRELETRKYQRFQCQECGSWSRRLTGGEGVETRGVAS